METLEFLLFFAEIQANRGGVVGFVRTRDIIRESGLPRTTMYYHLNKLLRMGLLIKTKRGNWSIKASGALFAVGLCSITPMDAIEYQSEVLKWQNS